MRAFYLLNETVVDSPDLWDKFTNLPLFQDSLMFALVMMGVSMAIVLIVLYNISKSVGKGIFPEAFKPNPKPVEAKEESVILKALTDVVPVEEEESILMDHEYDGIHELDNNLPPWWKYGFVFTIIWGALYLVYFHVSSFGPSSDDEFQAQMEEGREQVEAYRATLKEIIDEKTVTLLTAPGHLESGKAIFESKCFPCHGMQGQGTNGPNLTDEYWLHGGGIKNVFSTIKNGVPSKGMIPWGDQLSPKEMQKVASYILSLKGSNPTGAKAPEGDLWTE